MRIEPFVPFNHLLKAVKVSHTYVEQGDVSVTMESLMSAMGVESGVFTPTPSNINPSTTTINTQNGFYQRVGNIVTMSFFFELAFDVSDNNVTFEFDLPIASTFTSSKDIVGTVVPDSTADWLESYIQAVGNNAGITFTTATAGSTYTYVRAIFQYEIK